MPRSPAIPFHERSEFPFLPALEKHTALIRDELLAALDESNDRFRPYIQYRPGEPVNPWQDLRLIPTAGARFTYGETLSLSRKTCGAARRRPSC
ncbi:MAG: hypothetical protein U5K76_07860 [Woeseiaceae bacterium]|nr:hypothetical protein [Woeseiaceae bacterium]